MSLVHVQILSGKCFYDAPDGTGRKLYGVGDRLYVSEAFFVTHRSQFLRLEVSPTAAPVEVNAAVDVVPTPQEEDINDDPTPGEDELEGL